MRRSIDGLAAIIQQNFGLEPCSGSLFLFCGKRRDRMKALLWEGDGFLLMYKRLDSLVQMQDSIEHIEIRVAFLKALHILGQTSGSDFSVGSANARVLHIANLHHIFIEALSLVGGGNNGL